MGTLTNVLKRIGTSSAIVGAKTVAKEGIKTAASAAMTGEIGRAHV